MNKTTNPYLQTTPMASPKPLFFFLFFSLSLTLSLSVSSQPNDTASLTTFRLEADTHGHLAASWTGPDACRIATWIGVTCSPITRRVIALSLPSLSLRGPLTRLADLDQLRRLDLSDNRLNGTLSPLTGIPNLKLVYLAGNDFSGEISPEISSLRRLLRLDLSDNNLRGPIPGEISRLERLVTLRLNDNMLTGKVPDFSGSVNLRELNLTNNELYGKVPEKMVKRFGEGSFSGNEALCGSGLLPDCSFTADQTVPSNPSSLPESTDDDQVASEAGHRPRRGLGTGAVVAIVVACVAALVIASFLVAHCCAASGGAGIGTEKARKSGGDKKVYANGEGNDSDGTDGTDRSRLVFFDRKKQFELEDLLRASAEMLGKGSLGTVYRAVLDDGGAVAVKRLKDANPCGRREFERYMDVIGKLRHPNVVTLRAYYYAKEEKLLVYDYLANGSLHHLLHGNRGPGRIPLDWTTRISLALGAARGLARIHEEYAETKLPHGNIKSSNVLLDRAGGARVADFGLSLLLNPAHAIARLGGYRAPEQAEVKRLSQPADVYAFGVLLMELLTGRAPAQYPSPGRAPKSEDDEVAAADLPRWVRSVVKEEWTGEVFDAELLRYKNIEEELVAMLHVALACAVPHPEKRPEMVDVVRMIEEIRVEQSPAGEDCDGSRNSLSPSLATTEDGLP